MQNSNEYLDMYYYIHAASCMLLELTVNLKLPLEIASTMKFNPIVHTHGQWFFANIKSLLMDIAEHGVVWSDR